MLKFINSQLHQQLSYKLCAGMQRAIGISLFCITFGTHNKACRYKWKHTNLEKRPHPDDVDL